MSIATDKTRLDTAKADLKTFLEDNGVTVPAGTKIDGMVGLLADVETGTARPTVLVKSSYGTGIIEVYDTATNTWFDVTSDGVSVTLETALMFRNTTWLLSGTTVTVHKKDGTSWRAFNPPAETANRDIWPAVLLYAYSGNVFENLPLTLDMIDYVEVSATVD